MADSSFILEEPSIRVQEQRYILYAGRENIYHVSSICYVACALLKSRDTNILSSNFGKLKLGYVVT